MQSKYLAIMVSASGLLLTAVAAWGLMLITGLAWIGIFTVLSACGLATVAIGIILYTRDLIEEEPLLHDETPDYLPFQSVR